MTFTIATANPTCAPPAGLTATYGQKLSEVTMTNAESNTHGSWEWMTPTDPVGDAGMRTHKAKFIPEGNNYNVVEGLNVTVTVNKAN